MVWKCVAILCLFPASAFAQDDVLKCAVQKLPPVPTHEVIVTGQVGDKEFTFKISVDGKPLGDPQGPPITVPCVATS